MILLPNCRILEIINAYAKNLSSNMVKKITNSRTKNWTRIIGAFIKVY